MSFLARRWLLALLIAAAAASQSLGVVHQVAHQGEEHAHGADHGALQDLFALDEDGLGCALLDQLANGAAPAFVALALTLAAAAYRLPALPPRSARSRAAPFEARAPPLA